ncbi:unnamed protein product [Brachionus calyciflorus]|uniref:RGS domain-containing protein n=1 Tax=Brachionus calyciflorus TaxID=104777 RepID=A0A813PZT6_9BILA|nr:unnamed protein product [Brachionus calyciflorus]
MSSSIELSSSSSISSVDILPKNEDNLEKEIELLSEPREIHSELINDIFISFDLNSKSSEIQVDKFDPCQNELDINQKSLIVNDDECASGDKLHNQTKVSLTNSLTDVNEDLINEKNNEIGRVTKWATGFEKLLEDPLGLQIFTEFLKKEFSEENIDFWVKCENFKKLIDLDEMKKEASNIWRTYLDTSSMCQINVDNKARSSCQEALQTPNNTMFELAQTQIFTLMKYDSYSRFLKSQMYKDCIVNEMEGKPILSNPSRTGSNKKHPDNSSNVNSNQSNNNINSSNNLSVNENSNQTSSLIPNASSNLATAVAVVASTGAALITNVTISTSTPTNDSMNNCVNTSNQNINNNQISSSNTCNNNNNKEKKRSTLIPWTKAFIKWKRLSGKDKKASQIQNSENQPVNQVQIPNAPSVTTTPVKGVNQRTPLTLSGISETNIILNGSPEINLEQPQASITLTNIIESKFCRVLCSNDGSSSVIQPLPGQTVYQVLSKIFTKKNIPWYKCDLYFVEDYSPIDPNMDAQVLGSKEISLVERSLFALSLIPIAINLCVKANMKKTIGSILQPILDFYQIKNTNCGLFLQNSGNCPLNINDLCSSIDGQHILVVHKQQANFFSQNEIDKLIKVSISDFIPNNLNDYHLQFDEMGVLKQLKKNNSVSPLLSPTIPSTLQIQSNNLSVNNIQSVFQSASQKLIKSANDDQVCKFKNEIRPKTTLIPNNVKKQNSSVEKLHNITSSNASILKKLVKTSCKKCSYTITRSRSPIVIAYKTKSEM